MPERTARPAQPPADARTRWIGWAVVALQLVLFALIVVLPGGDAWQVPRWTAWPFLVLQLGGLGLALWGLATLGSALSAHPAPTATGQLVTSGPFRWVRHPVYTGLLMMFSVTVLRSGSWLHVALYLVLLGLFWGKSRWEERMLADRFPGYADYTARTGRFLPRLHRPSTGH